MALRKLTLFAQRKYSHVACSLLLRRPNVKVKVNLAAAFHCSSQVSNQYMLPDELYNKFLNNAGYYEPSDFREFKSRLENLPLKETGLYGYGDLSALQIIYAMLPKELTQGENGTRYDWLRDDNRLLEVDKLWLTLMMEVKDFYEDNSTNMAPVTERLRLCWFENDVFGAHRRLTETITEVWDGWRVEKTDEESVRAKQILKALKEAHITQDLLTSNNIYHNDTELVLIDVDAIEGGRVHGCEFTMCSFANGTIYMPLTFLKQQGQIDDYLAFSLAREMARISACHAAEEETYQTFYIGALERIGNRLCKNMQNLSIQEQERRLEVTANVITGMFAYDHEPESEADIIGMKVAAGAGFKPDNFLTMLDEERQYPYHIPPPRKPVLDLDPSFWADNRGPIPQAILDYRRPWRSGADDLLKERRWHTSRLSSRMRLEVLQEEMQKPDHVQLMSRVQPDRHPRPDN